MAGKIQRLTDEVIGKIAAGEVVERPAAAIKELVENSLDAGASAVTVDIRDGGITSFRVADNGSGIEQSEIRMAFERHATSKINSAQQLHALMTLGFRGEALSSIAAVSKVTLTTRTHQDVSGVKVQNEGGTILSMEEAACPEGTTILVRDIFYNTPVRLKFLKKPAVEASYVSDLMMRLILSRPDVSFRYISNGKVLYHSAGDGKLSSAVFSIYGREMVQTMREVKGNQSGVVITGYVGIGEGARGNRGHQSFFINGRYMKSAILSSAVESACRERVMIGKFPSCVLHLTMPCQTVDVNVHPNKLEVRFQDEMAVATAVEDIVREAITDRDALEKPVAMQLTETKAAPQVKITVQENNASEKVLAIGSTSPALEKAAENKPQSVSNKQTTVSLRQPPLQWSEPVSTPQPQAPKTAQPPIKQEEPPVQVESFLPEEPKPLRIIGTVFHTYILAEYEENLLLIDQHAVHERLLFDRMMRLYDQHAAGQELLVPMLLTVTRREQQLLADNAAWLAGIGLHIEPFGEQEISIRSIPMILGQPQTRGFIREIIDQLDQERGNTTAEKRRAAILQTACKHAVKAGDVLSDSDIRALVSQMIDDRVTPTCPHGRPLVISLSHSELDKRFRRIQ